jgi:mutual gliding-motility protein MglA
MAVIDIANRLVQAKIVYYGPGLSGKTTNLRLIHRLLPEGQRSNLVSIDDEGKRTLFFDYLPLEAGRTDGIAFRFQLYTVSGQEHAAGARQAVLKGADGVVFVANAEAKMIERNRASLLELHEGLGQLNRDWYRFPIVMQYNKMDLPEAMSRHQLDQDLNEDQLPSVEASAIEGRGVIETLRTICRSVARSL